MNSKRIGRRTVALQTPPSVLSFANIGGRMEGQGPLAKYFDELCDDSFFGEKTWEKAEATMQRRVLRRALEQAGLKPGDVDYVLAGDLLNQCIGSSFGLRELGIPFFGLYGACSTMGEALALASLLIDGGFAETVAAQASSHFCTAERQYRMPVPYGSQRSPTAQWTATAAGAALVGFSGKPPFIRAATVGKIEDMGITDLNNMGAAMAGAAYDTLTRHMKHRGTHPQDYDVIITGDLGQVGSDLLYDLFQRDGVSLREHHKDCGLMIYDRAAQDVHAGGSGCGCSASMMCGHFFKRIQAGELKRVLYCATGALMSPTVVQQGGSIPGIAHCVEISSEAGG